MFDQALGRARGAKGAKAALHWQKRSAWKNLNRLTNVNLYKEAKDELFSSDLSMYPAFHSVATISKVERANQCSFLLLIT